MRKNVSFQNLEIWIWDILEKTHTIKVLKAKKEAENNFVLLC